MDNRNLKIQQQRLYNLFAKVNVACGSDIEMQSHWAKYICVLCAGFLENAVFEIYGEFVRGAASKPVADYSESILSKVQNPKTDKFIDIAKSFKIDWGSSLELFIVENGRKEAINNIMVNRHRIAHGENSDITIAKINDYFKRALEVVDFIEEQCKS